MSKSQQYLRETQIHGPTTREWLVSFGQESILAANGLHAVGWVEADEAYEFVWTRPPLALLFACQGGTGEVWADGRWQPCGPGQVYLAPARQPRGYRARPAAPGLTWENCWVLTPDPDLLTAREPTLIRADARHLLSAIRGLYEEDLASAEIPVVESYAHLIRVHTRRLGRPDAGQRGRLRPVWERVLADLARPWTAKELADAVFLSEEGFRVVCQRETGLSPMANVTRLRLRHAAFLLRSESWTVREIAVRVGYANPMAFSTAFRRVMGRSPREYRNEGRARPAR
jgi:AraC-like DNA-binding protein